MPSFDAVNYSLRPSKSIQRQIVFEGVRRLKTHIGLDRLAYVGFGSIWFTDFVLAHKVLGIDDMVSIELNDVGFSRATFNAPFSSVRVWHGLSTDLLPALYADPVLSGRPWMVWLDYDFGYDETVREDVQWLVEHAPANSILIITFNGHEMKYGTAADRPQRLKDLFGDLVPDDLSKASCKDERMQQTLATFALDYMSSIAANLARPGGFQQAFRVIYRDNAPMVTVGGVLSARGASRVVADAIAAPDWPCRPTHPITAPHLTIREASVLQSKLPNGPLNRAAVQALGFDLEDDQIEAFATYYRQYPAFAQIVA